MNIVLIGMHGSGKSTVGAILARELRLKLIEIDELIVRKAGLSVPKMVKQHGWDYFRDMEEKVTEEIAILNDLVVSTGGGVVVRQQNITNLKRKGIVFFLLAKIDTLIQRIGEGFNRPLLTGKGSLQEDVEEVWRQRKHLYLKAADEIINTERRKPEEVVQYVQDIIEAKYAGR